MGCKCEEKQVRMGRQKGKMNEADWGCGLGSVKEVTRLGLLKKKGEREPRKRRGEALGPL